LEMRNVDVHLCNNLMDQCLGKGLTGGSR